MAHDPSVIYPAPCVSGKCIIGNVTDVLPTLPPREFQLIVTSPPYWTIKDYAHPDQIGKSDTYSGYLRRLDTVWQECFRVLSPGCKMVINVGDQFLRAQDNYGVYQVLPIHADILTSMVRIGYRHLGSIIWRKITTTKTSGGGTFMGSLYYPRDGYVTFEHEYIMLFKKPGTAPKPTSEAKAQSKLTKDQRSLWFRGIWDIPPARGGNHPARFPFELPERLIRMFSFHGEQVLDPFAGSCTTLMAAEAHGRRGLGIELNPGYVPVEFRRHP